MSEQRALLLTDVVDSTKLSEQLGDAAMAEVWSRTTGRRATCCRCGAAARSTRPTACC
jgi:class 3 adenylate cyclase